MQELVRFFAANLVHNSTIQCHHAAIVLRLVRQFRILLIQSFGAAFTRGPTVKLRLPGPGYTTALAGHDFNKVVLIFTGFNVV